MSCFYCYSESHPGLRCGKTHFFSKRLEETESIKSHSFRAQCVQLVQGQNKKEGREMSLWSLLERAAAVRWRRPLALGGDAVDVHGSPLRLNHRRPEVTHHKPSSDVWRRKKTENGNPAAKETMKTLVIIIFNWVIKWRKHAVILPDQWERFGFELRTQRPLRSYKKQTFNGSSCGMFKCIMCLYCIIIVHK